MIAACTKGYWLGSYNGYQWKEHWWSETCCPSRLTLYSWYITLGTRGFLDNSYRVDFHMDEMNETRTYTKSHSDYKWQVCFTVILCILVGVRTSRECPDDRMNGMSSLHRVLAITPHHMYQEGTVPFADTEQEINETSNREIYITILFKCP